MIDSTYTLRILFYKTSLQIFLLSVFPSLYHFPVKVEQDIHKFCNFEERFFFLRGKNCPKVSSYTSEQYLVNTCAKYVTGKSSTHRSFCLFVFLSVCLSICLTFYLSVSSVFLSLCHSVFLSFCLNLTLRSSRRKKAFEERCYN